MFWSSMFFIAKILTGGKKAISFKNVFDEEVKLLILLNPPLETHLFNINISQNGKNRESTPAYSSMRLP